MLVAFCSLLTSLTFVVLTYYDLRHLNPCCNAALQKYEEHKLDAANGLADLKTDDDFMKEHGVCEGDDPPCYEYYHNNRMPQIFDWIDKPVCIIYAIYYFLKLYIAVNRCQYFIEIENLIQLLLVIMPPIFLGWNVTSQPSLVLLAISRLFRLEKAMKIMKIFINTENSEVGAQVYNIATNLFVNIYTLAGIFMVIENFASPEKLEYFTAFYAIIVTITTVGYGDIYPTTTAGQIFFASLIPYVVFYLLTI